MKLTDLTWLEWLSITITISISISISQCISCILMTLLLLQVFLTESATTTSIWTHDKCPFAMLNAQCLSYVVMLCYVMLRYVIICRCWCMYLILKHTSFFVLSFFRFSLFSWHRKVLYYFNDFKHKIAKQHNKNCIMNVKMSCKSRSTRKRAIKWLVHSNTNVSVVTGAYYFVFASQTEKIERKIKPTKITIFIQYIIMSNMNLL